ncbi:MAG: penicillin-binding protein 1C [Candidatus Aminicenantes bacterium]|nr:penicillin-binding protein 1C [Candidatus Aminicenantes bacterium]
MTETNNKPGIGKKTKHPAGAPSEPLRDNKKGSGLFRRKKILGVTGIILALLLTGIIYFASFDRGILNRSSYSTTFFDRNGIPLRTLFSADETYAEKCGLSEVSPHFLRACVLIEDKRFYSHKGIVISSLFRALWQNIKKKRVVSGGSTITMQLAKLLYRHKKRSIPNKISEIFAALKFELHLSKTDILTEYINRLPFGNMIYGVKQAARFYFAKNPAHLSLNQAIYLALIPKSPTRYNPRRDAAILKKRWKKILEIFRVQNYISRDEYLRAKSEGVEFLMRDYPFAAPHFIDMVKEKYGGEKIPQQVHTTLDLSIQKEMAGIIREHLVRLRKYNVKSAAAVIIDNRSHEVMALMGSPRYLDEKNAGFVNLTTSFRQPGSTLKPFVYALALEEGYTPATILPDIRFPSKGGFFPKNHDGREHGPTRLRIALACSYNIPAFYLAMKLTPHKVIAKLRQAGFGYIKGEPGFYGETIALGSGEVKLLDLLIAYSAFVNGGTVYYPAFVKGQPVKTRRLFSDKAAFLTWQILADPAARFAGFGYDSSMRLPFPLAVKTGTSKGFRDKWAIGVNSRYCIGVWLGNPGGENMRDLSGVGSAATILRDLFLCVQEDWSAGVIPMPPGIVKRTICPLSGELLSGNCSDAVEEYFDEENLPQKTCTYHVIENGEVKVRFPELYGKWAERTHPGEEPGIRRDKRKWISFPQQGDFFYISDAIAGQDQEITFEVMGFEPGEEIDFLLNGVLYKAIVYPGTPLWRLRRGDHTLSIRSANRILNTVKFIVR